MEENNKLTTLVNEFGYSQTQLTTIINTVARGASITELSLFLYVAKKTGLDPFTKQIHFVLRKVKNKDGSYSDVGTIQTGIDGYRAIAERSGQLAGIDDVVYDSEAGKYPKKASVTVYKMMNGIRVPFTATARWDEYCQVNFKTNKPNGLWGKMPYLMLGKCAEALALRKAFPNDLSGLYTNEEMNQADVEVIDVTPSKNKQVVKPKTKISAPPTKPIEANTRKALYAEWEKFLKVAKKPTDKSSQLLKEFVNKNLGVESTSDLSDEQAKNLISRFQKQAEKIKEETKKANKKLDEVAKESEKSTLEAAMEVFPDAEVIESNPNQND